MKLYAHQQQALEWLAEREDRGEHAAGLFDEQGLGKTAVGIRYAESLPIALPALCLVPKVVQWAWRAEWRQWGHPDRNVQLVTSGKDQLRQDADVYLVTHGLTLRRAILAQLLSRRYSVVIVDEAHLFRGRTAKRTRALYATNGIASRAARVLLLTGTPAPNDLRDLWVHLAALWPQDCADARGNRLSFDAYETRYCVVRETRYGHKLVGIRNSAELRGILSRHTLRRRCDVVDLPAIRYDMISLPPPPESWVEAHEAELEGISAAFKEAGTVGAMHAAGFSRWRRFCGEAKIDPTVELIRSEIESGALRKVVLFAHHRTVLDALSQQLSAFGVAELRGDQTAEQRNAAVEAFQSDPAVHIMVAQILAGGVGVTLTAAHDLVFVEMSFVPGENAQAAKRCHRIGQDVPVRVRILCFDDSLDALVLASLRRKLQLLSDVVVDSTSKKVST